MADNWALLFARQLALESSSPLAVVFTLSASFLGAAARQYEFMFGGLQELESKLRMNGIPFFLLTGDPPEELAGFAKKLGAGAVVADFDPLRIKRQWKEEFLKSSEVPFHTVDAHNIVPAFYVSDRMEYGAYTLRPKINRLLGSFLHPFPFPFFSPVERKERAIPANTGFLESDPVDWQAVRRSLELDPFVAPVKGTVPGESSALEVLDDFIHNRLDHYAAQKNDPGVRAVSALSPYLHFGQLSAQRVALEVLRERPGDENTSAFLEELIVRRELSDNYCLYNPDYDNLKRIPAWAEGTLKQHRKDEREFIYERADFEFARTHDDLWNAAQLEMVKSGRMHGYLRMYWAKKILEWSPAAEQAMAVAVALNDRYQLDGRDPNGYAGCAWAIGGEHDRAWAERPVFGKIRYMNRNGCQRKFDTAAYIREWT